MNKVALLSVEDRQALFGETASLMNTTSAIIEKDFWVVWVLDKLFANDDLQKLLMFKGGTSLSKVFNLIGRFSEDIDLILDWREVSDEDPWAEKPSKTQQNKFNNKINEVAKTYIRNKLLPVIQQVLSPVCSCELSKDDGFTIYVTYPATFKDKYLRSEILLEIGPLASWAPSDVYQVSSYVSQHFPKLFDKPVCQVNAIVAKRTFWEKATILHQEANRPNDKLMPLRCSRHYYDLAIMAKSEVVDSALGDIELLAKVVEFKNKFYPSSWANFDTAKPGSIKLAPNQSRIGELEKDYKAMENMVFDKKLSFEEIVNILQKLEDKINQI